jgi:DNA modification methylase
MPTKAELIWDGKYDAIGKRVAPLRTALPFQTVETVNESAQERDRSLFQFASQEQPWRNRLIWGDKKYVLPALLPEFAGKVNLIYIDPPFDTGADFSFTAAVPDHEDEEGDAIAFTKQPSIIEQKAYRDTWGRGLDSYLQWFYETAVLLHELLAEDGSFYVHFDTHVSHYGKVLLDEVFGLDHFCNEVIWKRSSAHSGAKRYSPVHDTLLFYSKGEAPTWNVSYEALPQKTIDQWYNNFDEDGRRFNRADLTAAGTRTGSSAMPWRGIDPTAKGRHWAIPRFAREIVGDLDTFDALDALDAAGRIFWPKKEDGVPMLKRYIEDSKGVPALDVITEVAPLNNATSEPLGYPTQKPEALLERILKASSNERDLVLDCFCGSGTTAAVAEKLNRRWIACDLGRFAIHTTRKRLLQVPGIKPFVVQNLGKYERQLWQAGAFAAEPGAGASGWSDAERHRAYVAFILKLFGAAPLNGHTWIHGTRGGRLVHVGSVDAPVSTGDVTQIAAEFKRMMGTGKDAPTTNSLDVLGWDFAFELNEVARQQAEAANIRMQFKRIPRDVMDKRAVEQGDIKFFELAALAVAVKAKGRDVTLTLTDFVIPPDDVPEEVRGAVKSWSQWIDYWAVDWDNKGDTFHNQWQSFRTRKENKLPLSAAHAYPEAGEYRVVVKVIDILGNDTTKTLKIRVK